jgi:hypothetical protein
MAYCVAKLKSCTDLDFCESSYRVLVNAVRLMPEMFVRRMPQMLAFVVSMVPQILEYCLIF